MTNKPNGERKTTTAKSKSAPAGSVPAVPKPEAGTKKRQHRRTSKLSPKLPSKKVKVMSTKKPNPQPSTSQRDSREDGSTRPAKKKAGRVRSTSATTTPKTGTKKTQTLGMPSPSKPTRTDKVKDMNPKKRNSQSSTSQRDSREDSNTHPTKKKTAPAGSTPATPTPKTGTKKGLARLQPNQSKTLDSSVPSKELQTNKANSMVTQPSPSDPQNCLKNLPHDKSPTTVDTDDQVSAQAVQIVLEQRDYDKEREEWGQLKERLADHTLRNLANRTEVFGQYGQRNPFTNKIKLSRQLVEDHYQGKTVLGLHSNGIDSTCKWVVIDMDNHEDDLDTAAMNWAEVLRIASKLEQAGIHYLIEDSDGRGGYHIWIFFEDPIPSKIAFSFAQSLVADSGHEAFPKSATVKAGKYGNWMRLPGKHPKRDHVSRFFLNGKWIGGREAAEHWMSVPKNSLETIQAFLDSQQTATVEASTEVHGRSTCVHEYPSTKRTSVDGAEVREALGYIPADDYDNWTKAGMAMKPLGEEYLPMWLEFSSKSSKFNEQESRDKWQSFSTTGELTVATIFHMAKQHGWTRRRSSSRSHTQSSRPFSLLQSSCLADLHPVDHQWDWEGRLLNGSFNLLTGPAGTGKSLIAADIAARVSQGRAYPDGCECKLGDVLWLSAEESSRITIKPRLEAARADLNRIHVIDGIKDSNGLTLPFCVDTMMSDMMHMIEDLGLVPRLIVIDTLQSHLSLATNTNSNASVRQALAPLLSFAAERGSTILAIEHLTKASALTGGAAINRVQGSAAFVSLARSVWFGLPDPDDETQRILQVGKCNYAAPGAKLGLRFQIKGEGPAPSIHYTDTDVGTKVEEILVRNHALTLTEEVNEIDRCVALIRTMLEAGPVLAKEIEDAMAANAISTATKRRARNTMGEALQISQSNRKWFWSLAPDADSEEVGGDQPNGQEFDE